MLTTIDPILLDYDEETSRSILATYQYIKDSFKIHFETLVKKEKEEAKGKSKWDKKKQQVKEKQK